MWRTNANRGPVQFSFCSGSGHCAWRDFPSDKTFTFGPKWFILSHLQFTFAFGRMESLLYWFYVLELFGRIRIRHLHLHSYSYSHYTQEESQLQCLVVCSSVLLGLAASPVWSYAPTHPATLTSPASHLHRLGTHPSKANYWPCHPNITWLLPAQTWYTPE